VLEVLDLHCGYGKKEIVHGASLTVGQGEFVCIIGANGCGKTTLLKSILGLIPAFSGDVSMDGQDVRRLNEKQRARMFAYIPQAHTPPFPFTTADVILMGRTPYIGRMSQIKEEDRRIVWDAMVTLGIEGLAQRTYTKLSGGQQQLILIARAMAQQPELIIMDEPTASLDFGNQQTVLSRMRELSAAGTSVLMVTHDPHHAFYCADRVVVMGEGQVLVDGEPERVLTKERLEEIYSTEINVVKVALEDGRQTTVCVSL